MREALNEAVKRLFALAGFEIRRRIVQPGRHAWMQALGIDTVLDIGANVGQFAEEARRSFPAGRIYSFEPLPDCYTRLVQSRADDRLFVAANFALSEVEGKVTFHRSASSASSSLLTMAGLHKVSFPRTANETMVNVQSRRLDDVAADLVLGEHLLVKMDVQGAEDRVIRGGTETIRRADVVIMETSFFELYEGQPLFRDMFERMTALGFLYAGCASTLPSPIHGLNLSEDSVFINKRVSVVASGSLQ